jgi:hypothetical protein
VLQLQLFQSRLGRDNEPMETEVDYLSAGLSAAWLVLLLNYRCVVSSFFSRGLVANIEVYLVPGTDTELRVKPTQVRHRVLHLSCQIIKPPMAGHRDHCRYSYGC